MSATATTPSPAPAAAQHRPATSPASGLLTRRAIGWTATPAANASAVIRPANPADKVRALVIPSGSTRMASDIDPNTIGLAGATASQNRAVCPRRRRPASGLAGALRRRVPLPLVPAGGRRSHRVPRAFRRRPRRLRGRGPDHQARQVRQQHRVGCPLRQNSGGDRPEPETRGQCEGGTPSAVPGAA